MSSWRRGRTRFRALRRRFADNRRANTEARRDDLWPHRIGARLRFFVPLAAVLLMVGARQSVALELAPCVLNASEGRHEVSAKCGTHAVALDPDNAAAGSVELFVAVVDALSEDVTADPLVVIAGGPGDATTRFYAGMARAFAQILRSRDIVLVDQRGTGRSEPLHCENIRRLEPLAAIGADVDTVLAMAVDCLAELQGDPRFFTTSFAVGDLDLVRDALGYEQINLYGIKYGSRIAQHYLRRFPERTRSVVLDGVVPTVVALGPDTAIAGQSALNALFARCASEPACRSVFPNLRDDFFAVLERLERHPARVTFAHPRTGAPEEFALDRLTMTGVVRMLISSSKTASMLPVLIDAAYAGNYRPLVAQASIGVTGQKEFATGLNYAVICSENLPFVGEVDWAAQRETYLGTAFMDTLGRLCERWPHGALDEDFREPVASDIPVLFLSGEHDPITPSRYVPLAAQRLTNYTELLGRGQGHGMIGVRCAQQVMAAFVDDPNPNGLDLGCAERIRPFPLFTSALGPTP